MATEGYILVYLSTARGTHRVRSSLTPSSKGTSAYSKTHAH